MAPDFGIMTRASGCSMETAEMYTKERSRWVQETEAFAGEAAVGAGAGSGFAPGRE